MYYLENKHQQNEELTISLKILVVGNEQKVS